MVKATTANSDVPNSWGDELPTTTKPTKRKRRLWLRFLVAAFAAVGLFFFGSYLGKQLNRVEPPVGILPGEFERHDSLMFAWTDAMSPDQRETVVRMVAACANNVRVVFVVPTKDAEAEAAKSLTDKRVSSEAVRLVQFSLPSPWLRDYGPAVRKLRERGFDMVDSVADPAAQDAGNLSSTRAQAAAGIAGELEMPREEMRIVLPVGNLLSNGAGLYLTTESLLIVNERAFGYDRKDIDVLLAKHIGAQQVVYLQNLEGESTGRIDQFLTLAAPDLVVVGQCDPAVDPANAKILDENAEQLAGLRTAFGPLRVERIPVPPRRSGAWRSYTDVVLANGVVIMPGFKDVEPSLQRRAVAVYRRLFKGWAIEVVEADALHHDQGGPRRASLHLYQVSPAGDT